MSAEGHDDYGMAVEPEDVAVRRIIRAGLLLFGGVAIVIPIVFQIMNRAVQQAEFDASENHVAFPAIVEGEVVGQRKVQEFEVVDESTGVYRIPIDRAMDLVIEERRRTSPTPETTERP